MQQLIRLSIVVLFVVALTSCNKDEGVPAYININNFTITTDNNIGITDAWVYVDGKLAGSFELPASVPVLQSGNSEIIILPGIKKNGIAATRCIYNFYKQYKTSVTLKPGQSINISPSTAYDNTWVELAFNENFENSSLSIKPVTSSDTTIVFYNNDAFMGTRCGAIFLGAGKKYFEAYTLNGQNDWFERPNTTDPPGMFIELNYKCDFPFTVGITIPSSADVNTPLVTINPSSEWKKIYIDLFSELAHFSAGTQYRLFFYSLLSTTDTTANIFIDNIKIVQKQ